MAQQILHVNDTFPAATTVYAYPLAHPGVAPPEGVPPGTATTSAAVSSAGVLTFTGLDDNTRYWAYAEVSSDHRTIGFKTAPASESGTAIVSAERTFTETTGAGVYTGSVDIPAGATLIDIVITNVALWTATTSAAMIVGDVTDPNGFYDAVDLKATDLLAGESLSFAKAGGQEGADIVATHANRRYSAAVRTITGEITTVGAAGSAGRTRMTVIYSAPASADIAAATKV